MTRINPRNIYDQQRPDTATDVRHAASPEAEILDRLVAFRDAPNTVRVPASYENPAQDKDALQFGMESEYSANEWTKLLEAYMPAPSFGIAEQDWLAKSPQDRAAWVEQNCPRGGDSGLVKIDRRPELAFLPATLQREDSTGNLEVVLPPVKTLEEWRARGLALNEAFGTGSLQGTASVPNEVYFGKGDNQQRRDVTRASLGYLNFSYFYDALEKLFRGDERARLDPSSAAAKSFAHPWLGPMTRAKQAKMVKTLVGNSVEMKLDPASLSQVKSNGASFKYVGGTAYRPDLDRERVVLEVRDAHKDFELLTDRLVRSAYYLQNGAAQFSTFANVRAFDATSAFLRLPAAVQTMLKTLFPAKVPAGQVYTEEERTAIETFRNFAFPLHDWGTLKTAIRHNDPLDRLGTAQTEYVRALEGIEARLSRGDIDAAAASLETQASLARFADASGLRSAVRGWWLSHLPATTDKAQGRYLNLVAQKKGPLTESFDATAWAGPLSERLDRFAARWPNNVKLVEDVEFALNEGGIDTKARRRVALISTAGLSAAETTALVRDYTDAVSRASVSFPLGQGAGHLFTRLGKDVFDFIHSVRKSAYATPGSDRMEALVQLEPDEELRLRAFVSAASKDGPGVVGPFVYAGVANAETVGKHRNNKASGPSGHNCTSWITTLAITKDGRDLIDVVGATPAMEVHTNPGWWQSFLVAGATSRVQDVVIWTPSGFPADVQSFVNSWAFSRH